MLFFLAHLTARYVLSSLNISSGGTKFEIFREHVGYLHSVLLRRARLFDLLLQVMLLLITGIIFIFVRLRQRIWSSIRDHNDDITRTLEPRGFSNRALAAMGRHWEIKDLP